MCEGTSGVRCDEFVSVTLWHKVVGVAGCVEVVRVACENHSTVPFTL